MTDLLLSPSLLLTVLMVLIFTALFHLWKGRTLKDLGIYFLAAFLGFLVGQVVGLITPWHALVIGQVNMLEGLVFSIVALFIADRLKL